MIMMMIILLIIIIKEKVEVSFCHCTASKISEPISFPVLKEKEA